MDIVPQGQHASFAIPNPQQTQSYRAVRKSRNEKHEKYDPEETEPVIDDRISDIEAADRKARSRNAGDAVLTAGERGPSRCQTQYHLSKGQRDRQQSKPAQSDSKRRIGQRDQN